MWEAQYQTSTPFDMTGMDSETLDFRIHGDQNT